MMASGMASPKYIAPRLESRRDEAQLASFLFASG